MRVLILHRSPLIARGLGLVLNSAGIESVDHEWNDYTSLDAALRSVQPNIVLADIQIRGINSKRLISVISKSNIQTAIGIMSMDQSVDLVENAVSANANGVISLSVSDEEFIASVRLLAAGQVVVTGSKVTTLADVVASSRPHVVGRSGLTKRETQVVELVAKGLTNTDIADHLKLKDGTVKVHVRNIFRKLDLVNRTELTRFAIRSGLVT